MKKFLLISVTILSLMGCANAGYYGPRNTTQGAIGGAAVGALAGQLIGGNTKSTLIGAAVGGLAGAAIGNSREHEHYRRRYYY